MGCMNLSGFLRYSLVTLVFTFVLHGQGDLASITGSVTDTAQAVMPDVKISVRSVDTNITRTMQTNGEGYFTITTSVPAPTN